METAVVKIENLYAGYWNRWVLEDVSFNVFSKKITAVLGPSGCGKSTLIRCINRLHEITPGAVLKGNIYLSGKSVFDMNPTLLRRKVGMVFQRPNPFPTMTVYENVLAGYILTGEKLKKEEKDHIVEDALKKAFLWDEVKDALHRPGTYLSGGQQQRLCIARALAMKPEVILMDEPTSALDPRATAMIEELLSELKKDVTIVLVTHNISQAARISDYTAFLYLGKVIEFGPTAQVFTVPKNPLTEEYLRGKFG